VGATLAAGAWASTGPCAGSSSPKQRVPTKSAHFATVLLPFLITTSLSLESHEQHLGSRRGEPVATVNDVATNVHLR